MDIMSRLNGTNNNRRREIPREIRTHSERRQARNVLHPRLTTETPEEPSLPTEASSTTSNPRAQYQALRSTASEPTETQSDLPSFTEDAADHRTLQNYFIALDSIMEKLEEHDLIGKIYNNIALFLRPDSDRGENNLDRDQNMVKFIKEVYFTPR